MERLAADGQLMAYRHEGFWQPMDTLREKRHPRRAVGSGTAPWKVWTYVTSWTAAARLRHRRHGIVGSWLVSALVEDGAYVVALVRD